MNLIMNTEIFPKLFGGREILVQNLLFAHITQTNILWIVDLLCVRNLPHNDPPSLP